MVECGRESRGVAGAWQGCARQSLRKGLDLLWAETMLATLFLFSPTIYKVSDENEQQTGKKNQGSVKERTGHTGDAAARNTHTVAFNKRTHGTHRR